MIQAGIIVRTVDESRAVLARIDAKESRVLRRTGGYGRTVMRRTIPRRKKKPSLPGQPPHAHAPGGSGLKDVRYAVGDGFVVIGHPKYSGGQATTDSKGIRRSSHSPKPVPQLLNEGGAARLTITHPERGTRSYPINLRERPFRDKAFAPTEKFFRERLEKEAL